METEQQKRAVVSPDQLDTYLQAARSSTIFVFLAVCLLTAGFLIWGIFGKIRVTIPAPLVLQDGQILTYLEQKDRTRVKVGMNVETPSQEGSIVYISDTPQHVYEKNLYPVYISFPNPDDISVTSAEIVVKEIAPLSYLIS